MNKIFVDYLGAFYRFGELIYLKELDNEDIYKYIKQAKKTGEGLEELISVSSTREEISNTLATYYGINDVSEDEIKNIQTTISNKKP
ncbi:MAG: hypothetical protein ACK4M7_01815, partial [Burkholderiales bacterium]